MSTVRRRGVRAGAAVGVKVAGETRPSVPTGARSLSEPWAPVVSTLSIEKPLTRSLKAKVTTAVSLAHRRESSNVMVTVGPTGSMLKLPLGRAALSVAALPVASVMPSRLMRMVLLLSSVLAVGLKVKVQVRPSVLVGPLASVPLALVRSMLALVRPVTGLLKWMVMVVGSWPAWMVALGTSMAVTVGAMSMR